MKFFSRKTKEDLEILNAQKIKLEKIVQGLYKDDDEDIIIEILKNPNIDPYTPTNEYGQSIFTQAYIADNIEALSAINAARPRDENKNYLKDLSTKILQEECKQEAPNVDKIYFLLDQGANPYEGEDKAISAFEYAYRSKNEELLIKMQIATPKPTILESLQLLDECQKSSPESPDINKIKNLLEQDASPTKKDQYSKTAFDYALEAGNTKILQVMDNYLSPTSKNALKAFASRKLLDEMQQTSPNIDNVKLFLDLGANPFEEGQDTQSAFDKANTLEMMILIKNAKYALEDDKQKAKNELNKALLEECKKKNFDMNRINKLIENDASPDYRNNITDKSALDYAIENNNSILVKALHPKSKDKDALSKALLAESQKKSPDENKIALLLENGASPDYRATENSLTAIDHLIKKGNLYLASVLVIKSNDAERHMPLIQDALKSKTLLEDFKSTGKITDTDIPKGADPFYKGADGKSVVDLAREQKNWDVMILIKDFFPDESEQKKAIEKDLNQALLAESKAKSPDMSLVEELMANGASPDYKEESGKTALEYALEAGDRELSSLLAEHSKDGFLKEKTTKLETLQNSLNELSKNITNEAALHSKIEELYKDFTGHKKRIAETVLRSENCLSAISLDDFNKLKTPSTFTLTDEDIEKRPKLLEKIIEQAYNESNTKEKFCTKITAEFQGTNAKDKIKFQKTKKSLKNLMREWLCIKEIKRKKQVL